MNRNHVRVASLVVALVAALAFAGWASDFVTLQGERTVYTVDCVDGAWQGNRCAGRVAASTRYRYRALKRQRQVVFWAVGTSEPSGRFSDCAIQDGRNWVCKGTSPDAARSITLQMVHGAPVADVAANTRPFRAVSKWRWLLLKRGFSAGRDVPVVAPIPST